MMAATSQTKEHRYTLYVRSPFLTRCVPTIGLERVFRMVSSRSEETTKTVQLTPYLSTRTVHGTRLVLSWQKRKHGALDFDGLRGLIAAGGFGDVVVREMSSVTADQNRVAVWRHNWSREAYQLPYVKELNQARVIELSTPVGVLDCVDLYGTDGRSLKRRTPNLSDDLYELRKLREELVAEGWPRTDRVVTHDGAVVTPNAYAIRSYRLTEGRAWEMENADL